MVCGYQSLPTPTPLTSIAALTETNPQRTKIEFAIDDDTVTKLRDGYHNDPWCRKLISASRGMPDLTIKDGLWLSFTPHTNSPNIHSSSHRNKPSKNKN